MNKIVTFSLLGKNQIFEINIQRSQLININDSFILHTETNICVNKLL